MASLRHTPQAGATPLSVPEAVLLGIEDRPPAAHTAQAQMLEWHTFFARALKQESQCVKVSVSASPPQACGCLDICVCLAVIEQASQCLLAVASCDIMMLS